MVDAVLPRSVKIVILLSFITFFSITTRLNDAIERTTLANLNGVNNQIKDSLEKTLNSAGISQVIFAFIQN